MHWLLLLFSQLVFAFFTSVLLCTFMVTWQFMLQQFQSPSHKLLGKFSGTPWRQCALFTCRRQLLVILKHTHRHVKQWTVGRAPKNARMFTSQRFEARLSARVQSVVFVISRVLLLFCSGSLSGNETSFSASKPCWNSVTEMNVYRVFLVSNLMVFSFVLFKAIPLSFFYCRMRFLILGRSVGWKNK